MMGPTEQLAAFVAKTSYDDIPEEVIKRGKQVMIDTLSCAVGGYTDAPEECEWIIELVKELEGRPEATVWFDGFRTSAMHAALANATMVHTVDFDDTHIDSVSHLGAALLGTVIAMAEKTGASGKEIISAFILGFEVGARAVTSVMRDKSHYKYWHPTATGGTIAAAAAAAKLAGLDQNGLEQAIGLGIDQAVGFRYCIDKGDFSKSLHPGWGAMRGVMAAMVMKIGATGPKGLLEYPTGFCNAMSAGPTLEDLTDGLGFEYAIMQDAVKMYPTIHCSHTGIESVLDIIAENKLTNEDIEGINLRVTALAKGQGQNYSPTNILSARLSIPYVIAAGIRYGQVGLADFPEEDLHNPEHHAVMQKIHITENPEFNKEFPKGLVTEATVVTKDGKKYEKLIVYPKGHPLRPATDEDLYAKYMGLATLTWSKEKAEKVFATMMALEKPGSYEDLIAALTE